MNERRPIGLAELREIMTRAPWQGGTDMPCRLAVAVMVGLMMPALAHAQVVTGGTSPTTILSNIATFILGPFGESLAVLGVIGVGFAFIIGRASLGLIGSIVGGLVLIFGASFLITQFVGPG